MKNLFKEKGLLIAFAAVVFFLGFIFVDRGSISGNTIVNESHSFGTFSMVGTVLALIAAILVFYILRKR